MFKERFLISHVYFGLYKYLSWHLLHICEVKKLHSIPVGNWCLSFSPLRCTEMGFCVPTSQLVHWAFVKNSVCNQHHNPCLQRFFVSRKSPMAIYGYICPMTPLRCWTGLSQQVTWRDAHGGLCFVHLTVPSLFRACFRADLGCGLATCLFSSVNL